MGVHGNGLTSLVWMRPTPRSTVIEFFCEGGFAFDYEYTTRALGMKHYGVQGDKYVITHNRHILSHYHYSLLNNALLIYLRAIYH
jgi:hypothetical protein